MGMKLISHFRPLFQIWHKSRALPIKRHGIPNIQIGQSKQAIMPKMIHQFTSTWTQQ